MDEQNELRLAKAETNIESLARNVTTLSESVRELFGLVRSQGERTEKQIQELLVGVTNASGPRKTDWQLVISAIALILALGAAIFAPLNMRLNDNKAALEKLSDKLDTHVALPSHPVSGVRMDTLAEELRERETRNAAAILATDLKLQQEYQLVTSKNCDAITALDNRLQREIQAVEKKTDAAVDYTNEARYLHGQQDEKLREFMKGKQ